MDSYKKDNKADFFMISNLGGGGADKYRENVYQNVYGNIPILFNYYYIKFGKFARKEISSINTFNDFHKFIDSVQEDFINKGFIYKKYGKVNDELNQKILLDSGASNIIRDLIKENRLPKDINIIKKELWNVAIDYYNFANKFKFNIVIGFDTGGKYTFKNNEKSDTNYLDKLEYINEHINEINDYLRSKSIEYVKKINNYYPKLYLTIHGTSENKLASDVSKVIELEEETDFHNFGIAIGGIASSKNASSSWFPEDISSRNKNIYLVYKSTKYVSNKLPEKNVHVLGGGGIKNIFPLIISGATSFDCQTPGRRAYDANKASSKEVYKSDSKKSFSKYLIGKIDSDGNIINASSRYEYIKINKLSNDIDLCGCPACTLCSIKELKKIYSAKQFGDDEAFFFAKQIINIHSIYQHKYLCDYLNNNKKETKISLLEKIFDSKTVELYKTFL